MDQMKISENVMRLAEDQKKEKNELYNKLIELEKQLEMKQALELKIESLRGALQVMKHLGQDEDAQVLKKKMDAIQKDLNVMEDRFIVKEKELHNELEKQLETKQAVELEIERLRGDLQAMKHFGEDDETAMQRRRTTEKLIGSIESENYALSADDDGI